MPTIYTQPGSVVFGAGKNLGQIAGERESYTRGVEQARLDMQKKQIADNRMMRNLARIDAEEKETRRQLEWERIAKRSQAAVEESKRRFEVGRTELTAAQQLVEDRAKRVEQERIDKIKRNEDMLRRISQGEPAQPAGRQPTIPSTLEPIEDLGRDVGLGPGIEREQDRIDREKGIVTTPTPVQKSLQEQYIEGVKKQITPIDAEYKRKLRVKAVSDVYNPKASASQNEMRIKSKYNELLKTAKEKNTEANLRLILAKAAKQKTEKPEKLTYAQKKAEKDAATGKKLFIDGVKRGRMVSGKGEWVDIGNQDEAYRVAIGLGLNVFDPDIKKAIKGLKGKITGGFMGIGSKKTSPYGEEVDQAIVQRIQELKSNGMANEQIKSFLTQKGLDPSIYGL